MKFPVVAKNPRKAYRVHRSYPWKIASPSRHNRFDILASGDQVMTVYAGTTAAAAYVEVLAGLSPDVEAATLMSAFPTDGGMEAVPKYGIVTQHWLNGRKIGVAEINSAAKIVDVSAAATLSQLAKNDLLAQKAHKSGFKYIDESSMKASGELGRAFTQAVAAILYSDGADGIKYGSRLGAGYSCVAGFVPVLAKSIKDSNFISRVFKTSPVSKNDKDLLKVMKIFGLTF